MKCVVSMMNTSPPTDGMPDRPFRLVRKAAETRQALLLLVDKLPASCLGPLGVYRSCRNVGLEESR